jgi:hypothetical protein
LFRVFGLFSDRVDTKRLLQGKENAPPALDGAGGAKTFSAEMRKGTLCSLACSEIDGVTRRRLDSRDTVVSTGHDPGGATEGE